MVNNGSNFTFAAKTNGDIIAVSHLTDLESAVNTIAAELNATNSAPSGLTKKLKLFTATTGSASLNIPEGTAPTAPATGDLWHVASTGELKLRTANGTRTIAFAENTSYTTINATSLVLGSTNITSTSASFANTLGVTGVTTLSTTNLGTATVQSTSASALLVRSGSTSDTNLVAVNASTKSLRLLNGVDLQVYADNAATTAKLTINGATGALSTAATGTIASGGALSAVGNITTTNGNITTTNGVVSGNSLKITSESTAYAAPSKLNTGGFTMIIGNGIDTITSAVVDIPVVIIPYDCRATALYIYSTDNTACYIDMNVERATWSSTSALTFAQISGGSIGLGTRYNGEITGTDISYSKSLDVPLYQNDVIRVRLDHLWVAPTAKQIALHMRVVRS